LYAKEVIGDMTNLFLVRVRIGGGAGVRKVNLWDSLCHFFAIEGHGARVEVVFEEKRRGYLLDIKHFRLIPG
jgi:hypothetical protein